MKSKTTSYQILSIRRKLTEMTALLKEFGEIHFLFKFFDFIRITFKTFWREGGSGLNIQLCRILQPDVCNLLRIMGYLRVFFMTLKLYDKYIFT